jgi:hypothetical protein
VGGVLDRVVSLRVQNANTRDIRESGTAFLKWWTVLRSFLGSGLGLASILDNMAIDSYYPSDQRSMPCCYSDVLQCHRTICLRTLPPEESSLPGLRKQKSDSFNPAPISPNDNNTTAFVLAERTAPFINIIPIAVE